MERFTATLKYAVWNLKSSHNVKILTKTVRMCLADFRWSRNLSFRVKDLLHATQSYVSRSAKWRFMCRFIVERSKNDLKQYGQADAFTGVPPEPPDPPD